MHGQQNIKKSVQKVSVTKQLHEMNKKNINQH